MRSDDGACDQAGGADLQVLTAVDQRQLSPSSQAPVFDRLTLTSEGRVVTFHMATGDFDSGMCCVYSECCFKPETARH